MKYFSLFSGIGGFELGIQQAYEDKNTKKQNTVPQRGQEKIGDTRNGYNETRRDMRYSGQSSQECIGYSEIDKYAIQVYEKHFPTHKNYGDITKIDPRRLPDFELVCGGFPCQSFSIAGKRGGFEDTRGTLFFDIARIAKAKRPRLILLENVRGLLSHEEGRTFSTIIAVLDGIGYDLQWQVLNSKNFGVPQNRERVFIVGHIRGTPRPKVFPIGETNRNNLEEITRNQQQGMRVYKPIISTTLAGQAGGWEAKTGLYQIAKTVRSSGQKSPYGSRQNWDSYKIKGQIRQLTPTECARLQGFDDDWHKGLSDTQAYKVYGNAVTTNVVKAVAERLLLNN